jgi:hypothetical protein
MNPMEQGELRSRIKNRRFPWKKLNAWPASPFDAFRRTARLWQDRNGPAPSQKRTHTVVPLVPSWWDGLDGRRIWCGRCADWLGSALKPQMESEKDRVSETWMRAKNKKPTSGWKWVARGDEWFVSFRLFHFPLDSRDRVECGPNHCASVSSSSGIEHSHTTTAGPRGSGRRVV